MSRENSLVTAQWVEDHLDDPEHRPDRGRRGHHRLRQGPHQGRHQARLDHRPAGPGPPRLRQQGAVRGAAVRARRRQRRHRRALRRQQQLVRRLRLLVLQALRPRGRQAARRRPQEVGARLPRADRRAAQPRRRRRTPRRSRTTRSAPSATRPSRRSACKNLVDVRSPDEYAGRLLAPAHLPQEQAQRAGHIPTAANVPWSKAANDDGTFRSDDELKELYTEAGVDWEQGHHRLLPHRRALLAHLVRAQGAARPAERQELRRLLDRVRLARRRPGRPRRRARVRPDVRRDRGRPVARRRRRRQGGRHPGPGDCATASRSATPTCGCSTAPASSPPRCRPRRPGTSGSSPATGEWTLRTLAPKAEPVDQKVRRRRRLGRRGDDPDLTRSLTRPKPSASQRDSAVRAGQRSRIRVTGPSLTDSTRMSAPNTPALDVGAEPLELGAHGVVRRLADLARAPPPAQVGRRPLRASPYSVNWLTTSTGAPTSEARPLVAQEPELPDLAGHPGDLVRPVVVGDAEVDEQARPVDRADDLAVDRHPSRRAPAGSPLASRRTSDSMTAMPDARA